MEYRVDTRYNVGIPRWHGIQRWNTALEYHVGIPRWNTTLAVNTTMEYRVGTGYNVGNDIGEESHIFLVSTVLHLLPHIDFEVILLTLCLLIVASLFKSHSLCPKHKVRKLQ
jgi:hypothetical protein